MMAPKLLFYVQHLLGIGHLVRAGRVARALAKSFDIRLVAGGEVSEALRVEGIETVRLPPVKAGDKGFSALAHSDGRPFSDGDKAARRDMLLDVFEAFAPDILVLEAFPFGRRAMRFELVPLLVRAAARAPRPLIACSVRDILQEARPERQAETTDLIRRFCDLVLVHGDPGLIRLDATFPGAAAFPERIAYTGMVGPALPSPAVDEKFDVVVSVGGGAVGARLLAAALAARPLTRLRAARWLLLTGPNAGPGLTGMVGEGSGVTVRPFVPDLPAYLAQAKVSVSQAGYNTVADLVASRCRAVLVPFAAAGETEQSRRATLFAERGWAVSVPEAGLEPALLARAVEQALDLPGRGANIALDGAERSRAILLDRYRRHRHT